MKEYSQTDKHIHLLCQLIAKVNRTYVPSKEDESHTNLYFDSVENKIYGRWFYSEKTKYIFTLNVVQFRFELLDDKRRILYEIPIESRTMKEVESNVEALFKSVKFDTTGLTKVMNYEINEYEFKHNVMQPINDDLISEWAFYRSMANSACYDLLGFSQMKSEVRIWPHHFDTGIYFEANDRISMGFGLAMEDDMIRSPYFYFAGYPSDGELVYEDTPTSKYWTWQNEENWKGCTLSLIALNDISEAKKKEIIQNYFSSVYKWFVKQ